MGRKAGVPNKITKAREEALAKKGLMPLDYMLGILRDTSQPYERRDWAAEKAAPYAHPKLATVQHQGDKDNPVHHVIEERIVDPHD